MRLLKLFIMKNINLLGMFDEYFLLEVSKNLCNHGKSATSCKQNGAFNLQIVTKNSCYQIKKN